MITLHYKKIRLAALLCLAVPAWLFFAGWLKPLFGLPCLLLLALAVFFARKPEDRAIRIRPSTLAALLLLVLLWAFLSGQGGFFTQKSDYEYRNMIFRDLITYAWPVRYGGNHDESLVYYIGYWLLPALFGKIGAKCGGFAVGWLAARIAVLLWTTVQVYLSFLLVLFRVGTGRRKAAYICFFVFVCFSGMDALGALSIPAKFLTHIEWWSGYFQYSSMSTQLCWVFNQAVPAWLACSLAFNEKDETSFALFGLLLLPTSPLPLVGLAVYMLVFAACGFVRAVKQKEIAAFFKRIFTPQNLLAVITLAPVFLLYYANNAVSGDEQGGGSAGVNAVFADPLVFIVYIMFLMLEFGFLWILLRRESARFDAYIVLASLLAAPLISVGHEQDFCMRASIPALFLLMLMLMQYLVKCFCKADKKKDKKSPNAKQLRVKCAIVLMVFLIGCITPLVEYASSARLYVTTKGACVTAYDKQASLAALPLDAKMNFVGTQSEESAFYRYIAKEK